MGGKLNYEKVLEEILKMCEEINEIPKIKDIYKRKIIGNMSGINNYCDKLGYGNLLKYLRFKGYKTSTDFVLNNNKIISNKELTLDILYELVQNFIDKYNKCPIVTDFNYRYNLPCWETTSHLLKNNNVTINDFFLKFGREDNPRSQIVFYNEYVEKFKETFNNIGYINAQDLTRNKYGLPTANWLVNNCPDKNIETYNQFLVWCGFRPHTNIPKDMAVKIIYEMQSKLDRPITAKDFDNPKKNEIGIRTVCNIWGEVWKMQEELGLKITGKHAEKYNIEEMKDMLINLCNKILKDENRKIITYSDIRKNTLIAINVYQDYFKKYMNITLKDFLNNIGFDIPNEGNGLNHTFKDGEKVRSQFEFYFSNYLRSKLNLQYNIDYFRDIKYKTFTNCNKNSNCDYVINYKGRKIFIEVVGILKPEKKITFRTDTYNSKSKEKYRKNLVDKENMFIKSGLEYYILFTCDLNDEYLETIFNNNINTYKDVI